MGQGGNHILLKLSLTELIYMIDSEASIQPPPNSLCVISYPKPRSSESKSSQIGLVIGSPMATRIFRYRLTTQDDEGAETGSAGRSSVSGPGKAGSSISLATGLV